MNYPLISCLCVTKNRVPLLKRAIRCFEAQTYPNKELIVVGQFSDKSTLDLMINDKRFKGGNIHGYSCDPEANLGELRNQSLAFARGGFIAQWDDDDWHHPHRLKEQMDSIIASGRQACTMQQWVIHNAVLGGFYISGARNWEGSLLSHRSIMPTYPSLTRGEDSPVVKLLVGTGHMVSLCGRPELYVYTYHGGNTWDEEHFTQLILRSTEVDLNWVKNKMPSFENI